MDLIYSLVNGNEIAEELHRVAQSWYVPVMELLPSEQDKQLNAKVMTFNNFLSSWIDEWDIVQNSHRQLKE